MLESLIISHRLGFLSPVALPLKPQMVIIEALKE